MISTNCPTKFQNLNLLQNLKSILLLLVGLTFGLLQAQNSRFPSPKAGDYPVNDFADIIPPQDEQLINRFLSAYADSTSTQIVVVSIDSLGDEDPNLYAAELGQAWGVGSKKADNGLIFLIAPNDRKVAIQNGYGLEEYLTDARTKLIIENYILPSFREGDYPGGIKSGLNQIVLVLQGKFEGQPPAQKNKKWTRFLPFGLILLFFILSMRNRNNGGRGGYRGGGGIWLGGMPMGGGGGFSGGGFSGGFGGGGFGGGGFGGGGASGSW
jgi:uncharacterized protein